MEVGAVLFDASGSNGEIDIEEIDVEGLREHQLLWISVTPRDEGCIRSVVELLGLETMPLRFGRERDERPQLDNYERFFRFSIVAVRGDHESIFERVPIDFIVGKNFVVTIHDEPPDFLRPKAWLERNGTSIGELDAESFVASILDLHVVSYFTAIEGIEERVDKLDERVLKTDIDTNDFLAEMVRLRRRVSDLRRWFLPHREVFYAFSRPDFEPVAKSDSVEHFRKLGEHFENCVDAIESSRDTVLGLFELYATKSAQMMNEFIQRLTFLTLVIGAMGVVAGILGMNFEADYIFKSPSGFWIALGGLVLIALGLTLLARVKKWI